METQLDTTEKKLDLWKCKIISIFYFTCAYDRNSYVMPAAMKES